jgi:hypothetical protein
MALHAVPDPEPLVEDIPIDPDEYSGPERRDSERFRIGHRSNIVSWGRKYRARIINISHSGAAVTARAHIRIGERTILTIHGLGRYRGTAVRHIGDGVAIRFDENDARPVFDGIAVRSAGNSPLMAPLPSDVRPMTEKRTFRRADIPNTASMIFGGERVSCSLQNLSAGGTAVFTETKPDIGRDVILYIDNLGRMRGHVTRHFDDGISIEFEVEPSRRERLAQQVGALLGQSPA